MTREEKVLEGVGVWAAYYRSNPHRFAHEYLHLDLRLFQKILLIMMNLSMEFVFIGSRGRIMPRRLVIGGQQAGEIEER